MEINGFQTTLLTVSTVGNLFSVYKVLRYKKLTNGSPFEQNIFLVIITILSWYGSNVYYNIYNKELLNMFPHPLVVVWFQLLVGCLYSCTAYLAGLQRMPTNIGSKQWIAASGLGLIHTLGNVFTNIALSAVNVSLTHTIKASEPLFSLLLSYLIIGTVPKLSVTLSIIPIIAGVMLASVSEVSFNWRGCTAALSSCLSFQFMTSGVNLSEIELFSLMTITSLLWLSFYFLIFAPEHFFSIIRIYTHWSEDTLPPRFMRLLFYSTVTFQTYQLLSYVVLARVNPITHSIGNCMKRVSVILSSVIFFRISMNFCCAIGTINAILGIFLYSQVKSLA